MAQSVLDLLAPSPGPPPPRKTRSVLDLLQETVPAPRPTVTSLGYPRGYGEQIYLRNPGAIVAAIRQAEGVPSYGNMALAQTYGGHEQVPEDTGRAATAAIIHRRFQEWVRSGRPGDFLDYLRDRYAPVGAANDPENLNVNWLSNVVRTLPTAGLAGAPAAPVGFTPTGYRKRTIAEEEAATRASQEEAIRQGLGYRRYGAFVPRPPAGAFTRGAAVAVPGGHALAEAQRQALYDAKARIAAAQGTVVGPPAAPTLGERAAGFAGTTVGFVTLTGPLLMATGIGQATVAAMGPFAARLIAPKFLPVAATLLAAGGEGMLFGWLDTMIADYGVIKNMNAEDATRYAASKIGITGAEFAAFAAGFRGLHALIRRGILTVRNLRSGLDQLAAFSRDPIPFSENGVPVERLSKPERLAIMRGAERAYEVLRGKLEFQRQFPLRPIRTAEVLRRPGVELISPTEQVRMGQQILESGKRRLVVPGVPRVRQPVTAEARREKFLELMEERRSRAIARRAAQLPTAAGGVVLAPAEAAPPRAVIVPGAPAPTRPLIVPEEAARRPGFSLQLPLERPARPPAEVPIPPPAAAPPARTLAEQFRQEPALRRVVAEAEGEPVWAEVGRAKTAIEARRMLTSTEAQYPDLEIRTRPANPKRPGGAQVIEARARSPQGMVPGPTPPPDMAPPAAAPTAAPIGVVQPARARPGEAAPLTEAQKEMLRQRYPGRKAKGAKAPAVPAGPTLLERTEVPKGGRAEVVTAKGTPADVQYAVVDVGQLRTSHDIELRPNPDYPEALQRRLRERAASEEVVQDIAGRLDPERLGENRLASDGAPVVGPDAFVEAGNGRVIALARLYRQGHENAGRYRQWLMTNASRFGLTPDEVDAVRQPVLVRIRTTEMTPAARVVFAEEANVPSVGRMSPTEQARVDAGHLTAEMLQQINPDLPLEAAGNRAFISAFVRDLSVGERGELLTKTGEINAAGLTRMRNALFARAYGTEHLQALDRLAETTEADPIRNVTVALLRAAPEWARLRMEADAGTVPREMLGMADVIMNAASTLENIRLTPGVDLPSYLATKHLFPMETPLERLVLETFGEYARSGKKLAAILSEYPKVVRDSARQLAPGQETLITMPEAVLPTLEFLWEQTLNRAVGAPVAAVSPKAATDALDAYLKLPKLQRKVVKDAVDAARAALGHDPKTVQSARRVARDAYERYHTTPTGQQRPLSHDFFDRFVDAQTFAEEGPAPGEDPGFLGERMSDGERLRRRLARLKDAPPDVEQRVKDSDALYGEDLAAESRKLMREGLAKERAKQTPLEIDGDLEAAAANAARSPGPPPAKEPGLEVGPMVPAHAFRRIGGRTFETVYLPMTDAWETQRINSTKRILQLNQMMKDLGMRWWSPKRNAAIGERLFRALDTPGQGPPLSAKEQTVADQLRGLFDHYADQLDVLLKAAGKPPINRRTNYITHLINDTIRYVLESEKIPPRELYAALKYQVPGEVFNPFLLQRRANLPVKPDAFGAARAYIYTAERKLAFDPILPQVRAALEGLPTQARDYAEWFMRWTMGQAGMQERALDTSLQAISRVAGRKRVRIPADVARALGKEVAADVGEVEVLVPRILVRSGTSRRVAGFLKLLNYWSFIGWNFKVGLIVNPTQYVATVARLRGHPHQVLTDAAAGQLRVFADIFRPSRWRYWQERGVLTDMERWVGDEIAFGRGMAGDVMMMFMKLSEFMLRVGSTTAKARELGRIERIHGEEALRLAKEFSDFNNYRFGRPYTPRSFATPFGSLLFAYQHFASNSVYLVADMAGKLRARALVPDAYRAMRQGPRAFGEFLNDLEAGDRGQILRYIFYLGVTSQVLAPLGFQFWQTAVKGVVPTWAEGVGEAVSGFVTGDTDRMRRGAARIVIPPAFSQGLKSLIPLRAQWNRTRRAIDAYERGILNEQELLKEIVSGSRAREISQILRSRARGGGRLQPRRGRRTR